MTIIITDDFTDTSGTLLINHLTDQGDSWLEPVRNATTSDFATTNANSLRAATADEASSGLLDIVDKAVNAEMAVSVTVRTTLASGTDDPIGLVARYVDTTNYLLLQARSNAATTDLRITQLINGTPTDVGAGSTQNINSGDKIKIECLGTTATAFQDTGSGFVSLFSATVLDRGDRAGVFVGNVTGTVTHDISRIWRLDDFIVEEFGAPPVGASSRRHFDSLIGGNI